MSSLPAVVDSLPHAATLQISVASEADAAEWDVYVTSQAESATYHEWVWRRVFTRAFGHEVIYLMARLDGVVRGVLPLVHLNTILFGRSVSSLPFVNYGGLVADSHEIALELLTAGVRVARERRCTHLELRHVERRFPHLPCRQHKVAMRLGLRGDVWSRVDRKARNQVRKAVKSGLRVDRGGPELVADFYRVFARNMRDLGTPVYSARLFTEVVAALGPRACVHIVRLGSRPVAAALTCQTGRVVELPWASSLKEVGALCPNYLLYWDVIERAIERGATVADFGRCSPDTGTFQFKAQWGTESVALHWEYCLIGRPSIPDIGPANGKYRIATRLWKRLPLPVATSLGPHIVRGIA